MSHSQDCISANRFGDGFDCLGAPRCPHVDAPISWKGTVQELARTFETALNVSQRQELLSQLKEEFGVERIPPAPLQPPPPVAMILFCPVCHARHYDEPPWDQRSHHTHACQFCGVCWRPAIVSTVGVRFLPGFKNDP